MSSLSSSSSIFLGLIAKGFVFCLNNLSIFDELVTCVSNLPFVKYWSTTVFPCPFGWDGTAKVGTL